MEKLEELYLSGNRYFRRLPNSIGKLKNLETLELEQTNLESLPKSMERLTKLSSFGISKFTTGNGPRGNPYYKTERYSSDWYRRVAMQSCPIALPPEGTLSIDLSGKNLKRIPFGVYMYSFKELDISNNQLTEIPRLLEKRLQSSDLEKLDIHNNPNLNHIPYSWWRENYLRELTIDKRLIKDLPKNSKISLTDKELVEKVRKLILAGKHNEKMSDEDLLKIIAMNDGFILKKINGDPLVVHLR